MVVLQNVPCSKEGTAAVPLIAKEKKLPLAQPKSSFVRTTVNITKCFIGAASFELPWAFMQAGVIGGTVGVLVLAVLSSFSLRRLALTGQLAAERAPRAAGGSLVRLTAGAPTFPQIGLIACGPWGKFAAWFGVTTMTLGVCGSYFVFVASTISELTHFSQDTVLLGFTLPITILLSWVRNLRWLAPTSAVGIAALLFAIVVTLIDASEHVTDLPRALLLLPVMRVSTFPLFLGNAGFLFLICTAILPAAQNMEKPEQFGSAFNLSAVFVTALNVMFALFALAAYGDCASVLDICTQGNVISNVRSGALTTLVKVALCVDLLFTTAVFLFPMTEALEDELGLREETSTGATASNVPREWARNALRALVCCVIAAVAKGVPFFSLLTGLTGGFGNNVLGFILPPVFYWRLRADTGYFAYAATAGRRPWELLSFRSAGHNGPISAEVRVLRARLLEELALALTFGFGILFLVLTLVFFGAAIAQKAQ